MRNAFTQTTDNRHFAQPGRLRIFALLMIVLLIISQTGCASEKSKEPIRGENYYLDTTCTVTVYGIKDANGKAVPAYKEKEKAAAAINKAFDRCAELDKTLSRTVEVSDISRINNSDGEWTEVSQDTIDVIHLGMEYSHISGGAFDITIGGVTELWDFHADPEDARLPDPDELAEAVKHVGFRGIAIDGNKVMLTDRGAKFDLGGIAKGYIGDRMAEVLEAEGVTSGIINLGGNVICIGGKPDGSDFVIGVEAPFSDRSEIVGKVNAKDKTLVTSGIYERKIEVDGKLYHHILSTETGYSVDTDVVSVTLCADKGRSCELDALSTICLIKGSAEAMKLIEEMDGIEAFFILDDGSTMQTSGLEIEPVK